MENMYIYRDRVLRNKEFKLYISTKKEAVKFYNLIDDPYEKNDLLKRELTDVEMVNFSTLLSASKGFPDKDNDPIYTPTPSQWWDAAIKESVH